MSFKKILEKKGVDVTLIRKVKSKNQGYFEEQEETSTIRAVVLPLKTEERKFWQEIGISKASFAAYTDQELHTGWQVEYNGERYLIRAYEDYGQYKKAILEAVE